MQMIEKQYKHILDDRYEAIKDQHTMKNLEDLESVAEEFNRLSQRIKELEKENKFLNDRIQEYEDGFYIIDNSTGPKLNQDEIIRRLNKYHSMLNDDNKLNLIEDEIDNKITVLTDAKITSLQNEDEELLGKIKFSIQVLRELKEVILE